MNQLKFNDMLPIKKQVSMMPQHQSQTNEWYTPPKYLSFVRQVIGEIDLDPASCPIAQHWVQAATYYTKENNGLKKHWFGKVFLNPPYGKVGNVSNQYTWSQKLIHEYMNGNIESAIMLVNSCTGDKWFKPLWKFPICFVGHRIRFINKHCNEQKSPTHSNVFVYFGDHVGLFHKIFSSLGTCVHAE
jgi:ParB family chromosome partitioning protein